MSLQSPLEGLLRPPVEWYSSLVCVIGILILHANFACLFLSSNSTDGISLLFLAIGFCRTNQGYKIWRYQSNLKRMPKYSISSAELPKSNKQLFLGKGFLWTPLHTQRLRDLDLDYNLHYRYPSKLYQWARQREVLWEKDLFLKYLIPILRSDSVLNPFRPYPDIGGEPCLHGVSESESDVSISMTERAGHTVVIGTTGVGKTRLAELLIAQDIRRGDVVIVLDPKGDQELLRRIYVEAKLSNREKALLIFHLGFPQYSARYNPIGHFTKVTQVATRLTNALPSTGEAAAFKEFAWKYVNLVARACDEMQIPPTYKFINFYITRLEELLIRYCELVISKKDNGYHGWIDNYNSRNVIRNKDGTSTAPPKKDAILAYVEYALESRHQMAESDLLSDLAAACELDKTYYDKITASVGPLLEKLNTGAIAELLSPDVGNTKDKRPVFNWLDVIKDKKIVYVGMDALTDNVISSTVGNAMLSDLVSVAGHLYNFGLENKDKTAIPLPRICLHSDEFNEVIGDEFIPILNKARGAGFYVTAYTQTWSDVEARLDSLSKAGQVAGNLNTVIMFRTKEAKTVNMLLDQLPTVPILRVIPASASNDTPHGEDTIFYQSTNEDRFGHAELRLIEQNDVLNLPKGQAFCLLEGGKLYKIRIPLPEKKEFAIPVKIQDLICTIHQLKKEMACLSSRA